MRQDQVLLVADADLVEAVALGEVGDGVHLLGGGIARDAADRLQRDGDDGVARHLVRRDVVLRPSARSRGSSSRAARSAGDRGRQRLEGRRREVGARCARARRPAASSSPSWHRRRTRPRPRRVNSSAPSLVHQDLDARLVHVVAPAVAVVDAQDRLRDRRAARRSGRNSRTVLPIIGVRPRPPPTMTSKPISPASLRLQLQADVVHLDRGAVVRRAGDRDLELARQVGELRDGASTTAAGSRHRAADRRSRRRRRRRSGRR